MPTGGSLDYKAESELVKTELFETRRKPHGIGINAIRYGAPPAIVEITYCCAHDTPTNSSNPQPMRRVFIALLGGIQYTPNHFRWGCFEGAWAPDITLRRDDIWTQRAT
jgi:hypothetical protein